MSEEMTETERAKFEELKSKSHLLLDNLKTKGFLQKPNAETLTRFLKILEMNDEHSKIYNLLNDLYTNEQVEEFLKCSAQFGLNEKNLPELHVFILIANFNRQTEAFKLAFLIMLKKDKSLKDKITLGPLSDRLREKSPDYAAAIVDELEVELRNAFAHQTYWFDNGKVVYCEDSSLSNPQEIELGHLMMKAKAQNILFQSFLHAIAEKARAGFFANL